MNFQLLLQLFFFPFIAGLSLAVILGYFIIAWYRRQGWLDDPQGQSHQKVIHAYPVPRGGGLVVGLAIGLLCIWLLPKSMALAGILSGMFILTLVGWLDDIANLNPYLRLLIGFGVALIVVSSGVGIAYITNPFGHGVLPLVHPEFILMLPNHLALRFSLIADSFALIWIVWSMNMMNWSKGLDGQLPGVVVIASLIVGILSLRFINDPTQWSVTMLASITSGAFLGLLFWNKYPQKMMPGYGAGSIAGYLLAILSILSGAKLATLILVLGIPMIDAIYVVIARVASGQSPVWGDRRHFHHKLLDLGLSKPQIAYFYWGVTLLLGIIALFLNPKQKLFTIIVIILSFGGLLLWLRFLTSYSKQPDRDNG